MKKYFAWVFFMIAVINLLSMAIAQANGQAPTIMDGLGSAIQCAIFIAFNSLFFYLWWKWK